MKDYTLDFEEALKVVLSGNAWVQGEDYSKGVVLRLDSWGEVVDVYCFEDGTSFPLTIRKRCLSQKYKIVHTQLDAMKNKDL
jgi:hypothetical protein